MIQGNVLGADGMEAAVEQVLIDLMPKTIEALSSTDFASYRAAFASKLREPPLTLDEEFMHFWTPISQDGGCLNLRTEMLAYLEGPGVASKQALVEAWSALIFPEGRSRRKVVVKYFANEVPLRPDVDAKREMLELHRMPPRGVVALVAEHKETVVLDESSAAMRRSLANASAGGGLFSRDLHCKAASPPAAAAAAVVELEAARAVAPPPQRQGSGAAAAVQAKTVVKPQAPELAAQAQAKASLVQPQAAKQAAQPEAATASSQSRKPLGRVVLAQLRHADRQVRQVAVQAAGANARLGDQEAIQALKNSLGDVDPAVRHDAVKALGHADALDHCDWSVIGDLGARLADDDDGVRKAAIQALGQVSKSSLS